MRKFGSVRGKVIQRMREPVARSIDCLLDVMQRFFSKFSTFHNKQIIDYIIDYNDRLYIKYKYIYIFLKFIFVFLLLFHNCTCLDLSCNTLKHFFLQINI